MTPISDAACLIEEVIEGRPPATFLGVSTVGFLFSKGVRGVSVIFKSEPMNEDKRPNRTRFSPFQGLVSKYIESHDKY